MTSIGLYIHIPFCVTRCTYCDFNAHAGMHDLIPAYTTALVREIERWGAFERLRVGTVFFGGGTPSEMPLDGLAAVLATVRRSFHLDPGGEITLEANPGTVDAAYFRGLIELGVNRVSLGVQSFDDRELRALSRIHSAGEARRALADARGAGFSRVNLDLIYGLPGQTMAGWRANVAAALELQPDHLSLYALSVEAGTVLFQQVRRGEVVAPDDDLQAEMYEYACEALAAAGYGRYEISNWALPGRECRHNLVYWRNQPYLGVGCGAHSSLHGRRFAVVNPPRAYIRALRRPHDGHPWSAPHLAFVETIDRQTELAETLMLGLRLDEGLRRSNLAERFGAMALVPYEPVFAELVALGLLHDEGDRLALTPRSVILSNEVFQRLLAAKPPAQLAAARSPQDSRLKTQD